MPDLPESIKQNISFVIEQTGSLSHAVETGLPDETLMRRVETVMPEISLMALVTADALEQMNEPDSFMMTNEISLRLKDIAFLCLDIQEVSGTDEVREMIHTVNDRTISVAERADLPVYEPPVEAWLEPVRLSESEEVEPLNPGAEEGGNTVDWLKQSIRVLRELLASLVLERDQLVNVEVRDIQAAYMREIGGLEAEAYQAESDVRILKARLEMMQASVNREEPVDLAAIMERLRIQLEEYQKVIDEYVRRMNEANEYTRKREQQQAKKKEASEAADEKNGETEASVEVSQKGDKDVSAEETEEQELKRLYRMIVKAMHPDLHPDQDEATKDLFKRAILAYKEFDLKTLREIAAMLGGENTEDAEDIVEALLKERDRLLELIRWIRAEIRAVKSRNPYKLKDILEDPVRLATAKENLKKRIEKAKKAAEIYRRRVEEMESRYG